MFDWFVSELRQRSGQYPDIRRGGNHQQYTITDACLSAFGVFFTQTPSFLAYQREMHVNKGKDNAQSLFGVTEIPCDNEIRNLLDPIAPSQLGGCTGECWKSSRMQGFWPVFEAMRGNGCVPWTGSSIFLRIPFTVSNARGDSKGRRSATAIA